ncbi:MAG: hypothetical protein HYZ57_03935, partial [Acidobacteria bacterium]|nr:hypothetical protein [Acidobacteriota bacterium]
MSFYQKYELLELVRDDGIKTFAARQLATNDVVAVHIFTGGHTPLNDALLDKLGRLRPEYREQIIDQGEHEDTPYLVTSRWKPQQTFADWVSEGSAPLQPPPRWPDPFAKPAQPPPQPTPAQPPSASPPPQVPPAPAPERFTKAGSWRV